MGPEHSWTDLPRRKRCLDGDESKSGKGGKSAGDDGDGGWDDDRHHDEEGGWAPSNKSGDTKTGKAGRTTADRYRHLKGEGNPHAAHNWGSGKAQKHRVVRQGRTAARAAP